MALVGPDDEHVAKTLASAGSCHGFRGVFDVLSSHNAGADGGNTRANWDALVGMGAGRPVWSSENPTCFELAQCAKSYGSMHAAVNAGVAGVVPWHTLGSDVTLEGDVTAKGLDVAAGLAAA